MEMSTQTAPTQRPPRRRAACQYCHQSKVKCSGGQPCQRCQLKSAECYYELASRVGKPRGAKNGTSARARRAEAEAAAAKEKMENRKHELVLNTANMMPFEGLKQSIEPRGSDVHTLMDQSWAHSAINLDTSCFSQLTNIDTPSDTSMAGANLDFLELSDSSDFSTPDSFLSQVSVTGEEDSYHHSTPLTSPISSSSHLPSPRDIFLNQSDDGSLSSASTFLPCQCINNLSSNLCRINNLNVASTLYHLDVFLSHTDKLLQACTSFLLCVYCPKNSVGLGLAATSFATFDQLLASLCRSNKNPVTTSTHARNIALGTYHIPDEDGGAIQSLMLQLTVERWRKACLRITQTLTDLGNKIESRVDSELKHIENHGAKMGEESGDVELWASNDIEYFGQLVQRVDQSLAAFSKAENKSEV